MSVASKEPRRFYGQDETDDLLTIAEATPQDDGTVALEVVQVNLATDADLGLVDVTDERVLDAIEERYRGRTDDGEG